VPVLMRNVFYVKVNEQMVKLFGLQYKAQCFVICFTRGQYSDPFFDLKILEFISYNVYNIQYIHNF
jgi:hypothetical protein